MLLYAGHKAAENGTYTLIFESNPFSRDITEFSKELG